MSVENLIYHETKSITIPAEIVTIMLGKQYLGTTTNGSKGYTYSPNGDEFVEITCKGLILDIWKGSITLQNPSKRIAWLNLFSNLKEYTKIGDKIYWRANPEISYNPDLQIYRGYARLVCT